MMSLFIALPTGLSTSTSKFTEEVCSVILPGEIILLFLFLFHDFHYFGYVCSCFMKSLYGDISI